MVEKIADNWKTWDRTPTDREMAELIEVAKGRRGRKEATATARALIRDKAALVGRENKLPADRDSMIPIDPVMLILRATAGVIHREVRDPEFLRSIDPSRRAS